LRAEGFDGRVIIVGDENHAPYSRPPLSKDVLRGEKSPERTWLRPPAWYASKDIELQLGVRAVAVDPHAHRVELAGGASLAYDKLLIATGGVPRTLDIAGAELPGVFYSAASMTPLRFVSISSRSSGHRDRSRFIGAEVAASARTLGCKVTMLDIAAIHWGALSVPRSVRSTRICTVNAASSCIRALASNASRATGTCSG